MKTADEIIKELAEKWEEKKDLKFLKKLKE